MSTKTKPESKTHVPYRFQHLLSTRELATVLAALRACAYSRPDFFGEIKPLTPKEILALCERLNQ